MSKHHQQNRVSSTNHVATSLEIVPNYEEIQRRAYQIYEEKGGNDFDNWLEAERVLKEERLGKQ